MKIWGKGDNGDDTRPMGDKPVELPLQISKKSNDD